MEDLCSATVLTGPFAATDNTLILQLEFLIESPMWNKLWKIPHGMELTPRELEEVLAFLKERI